MANMIPKTFYRQTHKKDYSGEYTMFKSLEMLPKEYYVFHSYRISQLINGRLNENEADFIVFHPSYGCLFIEAKNGKVYRDTDGQWHYGNGDMMKDPFDQAHGTMYALKERLLEIHKDTKWEKYIKKTKFMFCSWFPSYNHSEIQNLSNIPGINKRLILSKEALANPTPYVEKIMIEMQKMHAKVIQTEIIENANGYEHQLDKLESQEFFKNVLCPSFDIIPNRQKEYDEEIYNQLLLEQCIVLDFLCYQRSAAINGASGTGKTFVALERARRIAKVNSKVLFLCYNHNLKKFLEENYPIEFVDYFTIDGFACKKTKLSVPNYSKLEEALSLEMLDDTFEYKHIIVDEGQDFGREMIEESKILSLLSDYVNNTSDTSFFIFYDKYQLVNSKNIPDYLQNVDSKLTLYKNCRNTINIANSAHSLIELKPQTYYGAIEGEKPKFIFYKDEQDLIKRIDNLVSKLSDEPNFSKVIITCKGLEKHSLKKGYDIVKGVYKTNKGKSIDLYTSSTFKGLEADNVILIDVDKNCFDDNNKTYYVAASRAKKNLYVFIKLSDEEVLNVLQTRFKDSFPKSDKKKQLSIAMGGVMQQ